MMLVIFKICGTDGVTYSNFCELNRAACLGQTVNGVPVKTLHYGPCKGSVVG
uniref:Kazal-like domain-containing protein n=1 Tax=Octopus bimaculoides TaxID=37653 RepID=A0A0L8GEA9_OCTBM